MTTLVNFIQISEDAETLTGNIASLTFDHDLTGTKVVSTNPKAPAYRLFAKSPRNRDVEVGAIWARENKEGGVYLQLAVRLGQEKFYANLGQYAGQDDPNLYAVIPND